MDRRAKENGSSYYLVIHFQPLVPLAHAQTYDIAPDAESDDSGDLRKCDHTRTHKVGSIPLGLRRWAKVGSPNQSKSNQEEIAEDKVDFHERQRGFERVWEAREGGEAE